jgi:hypothetical protein
MSSGHTNAQWLERSAEADSEERAVEHVHVMGVKAGPALSEMVPALVNHFCLKLALNFKF